MYRWVIGKKFKERFVCSILIDSLLIIGEGAINEFEFSPDHKHLAVVSQDGFLRIFNYGMYLGYQPMKPIVLSILC